MIGPLVLSIAVLVATLGALPASAADVTPEGLPARELATESYDVVTDPAVLPADVRTGWARRLPGKQLDVAAAGASYNSSCLGPGPRHRLILAAVSPKYAVVYFESGGFAVSRRVFVFSRAEDPATFVWSGRPKDTYKDPKSFLSAIKSGKLWREEKRKP